MSAADPVLKKTKAEMDKAVEHAFKEIAAMHTGKASPAMVENVMVEAYGSASRLRDIAAITTPDARTIAVTPWDKGLLKAVEKAIQTANIGINPSVMGDKVRCPLPELSRERRQEMVKITHGVGENGRVGIRAARRDGMEALKKLQKDGQITEDDLKRMEKDIQKFHDAAVDQIAKQLAVKEKELMTI